MTEEERKQERILRNQLLECLFDLRHKSSRTVEHMAVGKAQAVGITLNGINDTLISAVGTYKEWVKLIKRAEGLEIENTQEVLKDV